MSVLISPSILSADFGQLGAEIADAERAGADWIHADIMDGRFVPNITFGPVVIRAVKQLTRLPVDVHLMIVEPERYVEAFAEAGADIITVHAEACIHLQRTLSQIRALGKKAGVSFNPSTSIETLDYLMDDVDLVLVMSVNPGFSGQRFLPSQLEKIANVAERVRLHGGDIRIQVDGGVGPQNIERIVNAGADVVVAGSAVFGQSDRKEAIRALRQRASSVVVA